MKIKGVYRLSHEFGTVGVVTLEDEATGKKKALIVRAIFADPDIDPEIIVKNGSPVLPSILKAILADIGETELSQETLSFNFILLIPDYEKTGDSYPGNIKPGNYTMSELAEMLRANKNNPQVIQFIADMMEE